MRIVLDLATSYMWTRPPVGIIRTEQRFGQFLLSTSGVNAAFCRFDRAQRRYVHVGDDEARRLLHVDARATSEAEREAPQQVPEEEEPERGEERERQAIPEPPAPIPATRAPIFSRRQRFHGALKRSAHAVVHRMPEPLRPEAHEAFKAADVFGRRTMRFGSSYLRWLLRRFTAPRIPPGLAPPAPVPAANISAPGQFKFEPDDVYFSMGLDWEYNDLGVLYQQRQLVGFRTILHCYDTIPVLYPHLMSFDARQHFVRYFVDLAHAADRVVAISECSKRDFTQLMEDLGGPQPPVDVAILGTEIESAEKRVRPPSTFEAGKDFILCVSTIEARKNHEQLYNVWDRLARKHGDSLPTLVIVGMVGWGVGDLMFRIRTNPWLHGRIVIFDNVPDGELVWLYRNCLFTVFPSHYEGWGLPVVESFALGKPCVCSTAPAVLEAAQGLGVALDPLDTPAWCREIERMWKEPGVRESSAARLRQGFRAQTWQAHGARLLSIARQTAGT